MGSSENMAKLRGILRTFADLIRQGEGTNSPITVSLMRQKMALIDMSTFTINDGSLTGYSIVKGTTDSSTPYSTLNYFEKLMTNFANKVRVGLNKLDIDDIEEEKDLVCGVHKVDGKYGLVLPNSSSVTSVGINAFSQNENLNDIYMPNNITRIDDYAFGECSSLTSVNLGQWVISLGESVFYGCYSLESISIPTSLTNINTNAFESCSSLTNVYYQGTLEQWREITFSNGESNPCCNGANLYINSQLLTSANLQYGNSNVELEFYGCISLQEAVIPYALYIEGLAFYNCSSLYTVNIGSSINSVGESAFYGCPIYTMIIHYTKSIDSIYEDSMYIEDVLQNIYHDHGSLTITFIDIDGTEREISLSDICGGGSGSGDGSDSDNS